MESNKKQKKIIFSQEIDSSISGISLGLAFIVMAILVWQLEMFHNVIIDRCVEVALIVIGIAGTMSELGKISKNKIQGVDDLLLGAIICGVPLFLIWKYDNLLCNVVCFAILLFGIFGFFSGVIKLIYSASLNIKAHTNRKVRIVNVLTLLTETVALVVVILQLITELK